MSTTSPQITGTWKVDPLHSTLGFSVKFAVSRFRSRFKSFDATLEADGDELRLVGVADVASIDIGEEAFHQHVMGEEFFDAERNPQLRFESTSVRLEGERIEVDGQLTLRGVTQPITGTGTLVGPVDSAYGPPRIGVELEAAVDRTAFGFAWNAPLPKGGMALANDVKLEIELQFNPEA